MPVFSKLFLGKMSTLFCNKNYIILFSLKRAFQWYAWFDITPQIVNFMPTLGGTCPPIGTYLRVVCGVMPNQAYHWKALIDPKRMVYFFF